MIFSQRDVIMMYHFFQIKASSSLGVNLSVWTLYFELIGCCRIPLNVSNSIRYSITIVQFNLSNLIGFDCSFLGHYPLNIQELQCCCSVTRGQHIHIQTHTHGHKHTHIHTHTHTHTHTHKANTHTHTIMCLCRSQSFEYSCGTHINI